MAPFGCPGGARARPRRRTTTTASTAPTTTITATAAPSPRSVRGGAAKPSEGGLHPTPPELVAHGHDVASQAGHPCGTAIEAHERHQENPARLAIRAEAAGHRVDRVMTDARLDKERRVYGPRIPIRARQPPRGLHPPKEARPLCLGWTVAEAEDLFRKLTRRRRLGRLSWLDEPARHHVDTRPLGHLQKQHHHAAVLLGPARQKHIRLLVLPGGGRSPEATVSPLLCRSKSYAASHSSFEKASRCHLAADRQALLARPGAPRRRRPLRHQSRDHRLDPTAVTVASN